MMLSKVGALNETERSVGAFEIVTIAHHGWHTTLYGSGSSRIVHRQTTWLKPEMYTHSSNIARAT